MFLSNGVTARPKAEGTNKKAEVIAMMKRAKGATPNLLFFRVARALNSSRRSRRSILIYGKRPRSCPSNKLPAALLSRNIGSDQEFLCSALAGERLLPTSVMLLPATAIATPKLVLPELQHQLPFDL